MSPDTFALIERKLTRLREDHTRNLAAISGEALAALDLKRGTSVRTAMDLLTQSTTKELIGFSERVRSELLSVLSETGAHIVTSDKAALLAMVGKKFDSDLYVNRLTGFEEAVLEKFAGSGSPLSPSALRTDIAKSAMDAGSKTIIARFRASLGDDLEVIVQRQANDARFMAAVAPRSDPTLEILRMAAAGTLPDEITAESSVPVGLVRELIDGGLLRALDASTLVGSAYVEPKLTFQGREYLRMREAELAQGVVAVVAARRGIRFDGAELRARREALEMSQSDLASKADLSRLSVDRAERGRLVGTSTLEKFAKALAVDAAALRSSPATGSMQYQSAFISYGGPDERFASALHERLVADGVVAFFFRESSVPGKKLHRTMSEGVHEYQRVLLLCSETSLQRPGVLNEIELVLAREAAEGGSDILIPVALDDFVFVKWQPAKADVARQIRSRSVANFVNATEPGAEFEASYKRLLSALEIE